MIINIKIIISCNLEDLLNLKLLKILFVIGYSFTLLNLPLTCAIDTRC